MTRLPRFMSLRDIAERKKVARLPRVANDEEDAQRPDPALAGAPDIIIDVAEPLPHQVDIVASGARFKLLPWGRRAGKSRIDFYCAIVGHGPEANWDGIDQPMRPQWKGIIHGIDVAWICPTYKQADPLWLEEIRPRFDGKAGIRVNDTERYVEIIGAGRLFVRTEENVGTIRGQGANLGGLIADEAAHYDFKRMWTEVLRWALMDNEAWAIISSTTNSGHDGNTDLRVPSYFNLLVQDVRNGLRDPAMWAEWYRTALDNPKISPVEFERTVEEIRKEGGGRQVDEEAFALILAPGAGLGFPEWRHKLHVRADQPEAGWGCIGTLDWGHASPGAFYLLHQGPGGRLLVTTEVYFNGPLRPEWPRRMSAKEVGAYVGEKLLTFAQAHEGTLPEFIAGDSAMWAVTGAGDTISTLFQAGLDAAFDAAKLEGRTASEAPQLTPAPKGSGSRATRKLLLHEALAWLPGEGDPVPESDPLLRVHPECVNLIRTIPILPLSHLGKEDVDTKSEDHPYDSITYGLHALVPEYDPQVADTREQQRAREQLDGLSRKEAEGYDEMCDTITKGLKRRRKRAG